MAGDLVGSDLTTGSGAKIGSHVQLRLQMLEMLGRRMGGLNQWLSQFNWLSKACLCSLLKVASSFCSSFIIAPYTSCCAFFMLTAY
jgi:hypothetical protein